VSATLLSSNASIRFVPDPSFSGAAGNLSFRAWDQTDGNVSSATGIDVSTNGSSTAYSSASEIATLNVVAAPPASVHLVTVDTTSDSTDGDTSSIVALISDKGADGFISLREAIIAANNTVNAGTPDEIQFNISVADPNFSLSGNNEFTILPSSALPAITDALIFDGLTQPGAAANSILAGASDATLLIEIGGQNAGVGVDGISVELGGAGTTIRGLVINDFARNGINLDEANNVIESNYLGTGVTGATDRGNGVDGIQFAGTRFLKTLLSALISTTTA
jgi:hypothetical protein